MVVRKKVAIIYNSHSGTHRARRAVARSRRFFSSEAEIILILDLHKEKISKILGYSIDTICVIGGDGTLQKTLQVLQDHSVNASILLIPRGSANVVAKSLRIPKGIKKNLKKFTSNKTIAVDVAWLNRKHFFVSAFALGYFSERITQTASKQKQRFGMWGYMLSFLNDITLPMHKFTITVDGKHYAHNGHSCFIVNTADLFGFTSRRRMSYRDGVFELVVASNKKFVNLLHVVFDFYLRRSKPKYFTLYKGSSFTIETSDELDVQIDGDRIPYSKRFSIEVNPNSQTFYI